MCIVDSSSCSCDGSRKISVILCCSTSGVAKQFVLKVFSFLRDQLMCYSVILNQILIENHVFLCYNVKPMCCVMHVDWCGVHPCFGLNTK